MDDELISISSGELTARIHPLGAELMSLTDSAGAEYMTDADPAYWSGHAPVLFPIIGSLVDDTYRLGEDSYHLPRHGFARRCRFDVLAVEDDFAVFGLGDSEATRSIYPFAFRLALAFRVTGTRLHMAATVTNAGDRDMPFSFGYHPAFAWPLPGGAAKSAHRIVFAADEPAPIRRVSTANGQLLPEKQASPVVGRDLALSPDLFVEDAVIWDEMVSRSLSYGADGGAWLDITYPDTPCLGLWQVPGAHYLCIEPWAGHADPLGFDGDFTRKPGIHMLEPGQSHSFRMDVCLRAR
ncbi:MAG: aldose 1-epimerase family protein [Sphingomonadales bacterium]|nr:aldose 1-epimerase family protein [Sphingomonadales bacterium]MDE2169040.1 aldose 1-epimerase family protein [Sphingomonadales bacterium]